jgi:hypothetical protein
VNPAPAVNVIDVPLLKAAEQFVVQLLMPAGLEFTVPVPDTTTVSVGRLKLAVMLELVVNVKVHGVVVPLQATTFALPEPLFQPVKFDAPLGVAVIAIAVPTG